MRGLLPWAALARSIIRASSMSSMVSCIWRSSDLAWATCLSSRVQFFPVFNLASATLFISVFSIAHIINDDCFFFQLKQHAIVSGPRTILVLEALQLFHIGIEVVLRIVDFPSTMK